MALDLNLIYNRSSSLWERLGAGRGGSISYDAARAEELMQRWRKATGLIGNDSEGLSRRIRWAGWTESDVRTALGSWLPLPDCLPPWCSTIQEISDRARAFSDTSWEAAAPNQTVAFEPLLMPMVLCAASRVPTAPTELKRSLLVRLSSIATAALEKEFSNTRPAGEKFLAMLIGSPAKPKVERYTAFVRSHLETGLENIFHKYPVLARLMAQATDLWAESTTEFLTRFETDADILGEKRIAGLKTGLSDSHRGHRTVIAIRLPSGRQLVYKPKDLGIEAAFSALIDWCNRHGMEPRLMAPAVWNRGTHGWVEFIEHTTCTTESEVRRHYERAGALMALLYALGATDCHQENIIASGEHAVLVDAEALLEPETRFFDESLDLKEISPETLHFMKSVARTGLLPWTEISGKNEASYEVGGFSSVDKQQSLMRVPLLKSRNTDNMHLVYEFVEVLGTPNAPLLNGQMVDSLNYVEEIKSGFGCAYRFLLQNRDGFLAKDGPLEKLCQHRIRFVFRPTRIYNSVIGQGHDPTALRDGALRSIMLDTISQAFLTLPERCYAWPVLSAELSAMEREDIPYFDVLADSTTLDGGLPQSYANYFVVSGFAAAGTKIRGLNSDDLKFQLSVIEGSFASRAATLAFRQGVAHGPGGPVVEGPELESQEAIAEAQRIAREISDYAVSAGGRVYWLGVSQLQGSDIFRLQPLTENLYEGRCGVAVFLAALDHVTGQSTYSSLVDEALQYVRSFAADCESKRARGAADYLGIGGLSGLPSIIYCLAVIARLTGRSDLQEDGRRLAGLITHEMILQDSQLDIMNGSAGLILALLSIWRATGNSHALALSITAANHLIDTRTEINGHRWAWRTIVERPLTGFSHGAAGIAYALLQMHEATDDRRYVQAARAGLAYERSLYSDRSSNWPDLREGEQSFLCSWCHGATGIGMSRLAMRDLLKDEHLDGEIEAAVQASIRESIEDVDYVCCGNFGRVELLLMASRHDSAAVRAGYCYRRSQAEGGYRLVNHIPTRAYNPGFFKGTAGIGYTLLRLAEPSLPSILLLETK